MANDYLFRRLRFGPPRSSTQNFVRAQLRRHRLRRGGEWLRNYFGFVMLGAMLGLAAIAFEPWRDEHASNPTAPPTGVTAWQAPRDEPIRPRERTRITVTDGDSLRAGGERIRLIGIDAPELRQTCRDAQGRAWACGRAAKERLAGLAASGRVSCTARGTDRYGRTLASCSVGGTDLGEALVREGLAVAGDRYGRAHSEARSARRGLWQGDFERPQDWRRKQSP